MCSSPYSTAKESSCVHFSYSTAKGRLTLTMSTVSAWRPPRHGETQSSAAVSPAVLAQQQVHGSEAVAAHGRRRRRHIANRHNRIQSSWGRNVSAKGRTDNCDMNYYCIILQPSFTRCTMRSLASHPSLSPHLRACSSSDCSRLCRQGALRLLPRMPVAAAAALMLTGAGGAWEGAAEATVSAASASGLGVESFWQSGQWWEAREEAKVA